MPMQQHEQEHKEEETLAGLGVVTKKVIEVEVRVLGKREEEESTRRSPRLESTS
jgi:hypothetical protein